MRLWFQADDEQHGFGAGGDGEDGKHSTVGDRESEQVRRATDQALPRGAGPDQQAHDQPEIVAGDVDKVALVQVLPPAQPGPTHAATIED